MVSPVVLPMFKKFAAPARFTVVAVVLIRLKVGAVVVRSPPLTATSPPTIVSPVLVIEPVMLTLPVPVTLKLFKTKFPPNAGAVSLVMSIKLDRVI